MTDLSKLDQNQLDALIAKAQAAKADLRERRRQDLRSEFEQRAASDGFTLADIIAVKKPKLSRPKYAHPTDPSLTWTGLGRAPRWLTKLASGGSFERFRVGATSTLVVTTGNTDLHERGS